MKRICKMIRPTKDLINTHHLALFALIRGFLEKNCCKPVADVAFDASFNCNALVAELAYALDLGSSTARFESSSLSKRTNTLVFFLLYIPTFPTYTRNYEFGGKGCVYCAWFR